MSGTQIQLYKQRGMQQTITWWDVFKTLIVPFMLFIAGLIWNKYRDEKKVEDEAKRASAKELTDTVKLVVTEIRDLKESTKIMNLHLSDKIDATNMKVDRNHEEVKGDIRNLHGRIDQFQKQSQKTT